MINYLNPLEHEKIKSFKLRYPHLTVEELLDMSLIAEEFKLLLPHGDPARWKFERDQTNYFEMALLLEKAQVIEKEELKKKLKKKGIVGYFLL
jgi:hypothetical protein